MSDIAALTTELRALNSNAMEITRKWAELMTSTGIVSMTLADGSVHDLPSIAKFQEELSAGNIGTRVGDLEALSRGLVQELDRVSSSLNLDRSNPYWNPLDLKDGTDSDLTDALYRAQIEDGLRLPYDGFTVNQVDRKFESGAARQGDWLLPNHTETIDERHNGAVSYGNRVNVAQYPVINGYKIRRRSYYRRFYYYGYYYRWWRYRYYGRYYSVTTVTPNRTTLDGSMTAQTFKVDTEKVLTGINLYCYRPGTYKTAANPRVILTEASYGRPDMDQVLAHGEFRDTSAFSGTSTSVAYLCNVDLDRPVLLEPDKSYAFVVVADAQFEVNHDGNSDRTGGVFYTQDGEAWEQDIAKDMAYQLRLADFGGDTATIEVEAIELSGGIASMRQDLVADLPEGSEISVEMEVNGQWLPIKDMDNITSLPPYTPMRIVLTGSADAMPLIDATKSTVTGFRPATALHYYSKERTPAQELRVTYELVGFNEEWHTFDPGLDVDGTRHTPSLVEFQDSADGNVRSISAVYELPISAAYRHNIIASTQTAAKVFDISSVIEINA
jgi:hypothetical protein